MKIILDDGTEHTLNENEQGALAAVTGVYIATLRAAAGKSDGKDVMHILVINEMMFHAETARVIKIVGEALGKQIAAKQGISIEELEARTEESIKEKGPTPVGDIRKMFSE